MSAAPYKPSRWLLYAPFAVAAVLVAVYWGIWLRGAEQMRQSIASWADDQRAAGVEVDYGSVATEGFPFFLRGAVSDIVIAHDGVWRWRAPRLFIDALPLAPDRLIFSARDPHVISLAGAGAWRIAAPDGRASIGADAARPWILDIESGRGRIERVGGAAAAAADRFLLTVAPGPSDETTIEASLAANGAVFTAPAGDIAAPVVEAMIALEESSAISLGPEVWRAAGGALDLRRIYVEAEEAKLSLSGRLSLDDEGRPAGTFNAEIVNPGPLIQALGRAGVMKARDAETLAASLTLAAIAGGGKISAPLVLEDGFASIAGVGIAELPSLAAESQP